jgi:Phage integrase family
VLAAYPRIKLVREHKRKAFYSPTLEKKVLEMAEQPLLDIFLLVFDSGARPDESVHLRWSDMLWDKNLIHIRWGKTSLSERHVPMSERVKQMLVGRLKASKSEWVFPSSRKKGFPMGYTPISKRASRSCGRMLVSRLISSCTAGGTRSLLTCWTHGEHPARVRDIGTRQCYHHFSVPAPLKEGVGRACQPAQHHACAGRRNSTLGIWPYFWPYHHSGAVTPQAKLLILWCAQRDSNSRPIDS